MSRALLVLLLGGWVGIAGAQQVGSMPVRATAELSNPSLVMPKHALVAQRFQLPPVGADEFAALRERNAREKLLHIGFARPLSDGADIALDALSWHALPDGSRVTTIEIASPDAAALRVSIDAQAFPDGLTVRTYAADRAGHLHGAIDAYTLAAGPALAWLPEQPGETLGIELHAAKDADLAGAVLPVRSVMHLVVTPQHWDAKRLQELGNADDCNIDIACGGDEWVAIGGAVAKYIFSPDGSTLAGCTGTLLNNLAQDGDLLFVTAQHCIEDASRAETITLYWHFERASCGGANPDSVIQTTGGGKLLATVTAQDMALVRLNNAPPASAVMAGWNANPPQRNTAVVGLHHPQGDVKKISTGNIDAFTTHNGNQHSATGPYLQIRWGTGTAEQGSSGSAAFDAGRHVIGTLRGGTASCERRDDPDYYGRFDLAYPSFTTWLGGAPPPPPPAEPTPPPTSSGGGGGHGGLLLFALLARCLRGKVKRRFKVILSVPRNSPLSQKFCVLKNA